MDVPVKELKARLAYYLRLAGDGEAVVVTSHKKPLVRLAPVEISPEGLPDILGVRWNQGRSPYAKRRLDKLPKMTGEPLSDWILGNRR